MEGTVEQIDFSRKIDLLRQQLDELQRQATEDPNELATTVPAILEALQNTLDELQVTGEKLSQAEEKWRFLVENVPDFIMIVDRDLKIQFINRTGPDLDQEEVIGTSIYNYVSPAYHPVVEEYVQQVLDTGVFQSFELEGFGPHDTVAWYSNRLGPIKVDGQVVSMAYIGSDITERRQAEELLRASEARFRMLAEATTAAIFIYQGTQNRYVNPATEAVTGYTQAELLKMDFWEVIHPDFREIIKSRGMERQQGKPVPGRYELKLLTKNGEERWIDVTLGTTEFEGELAVLGTAFDITERKQAEEKTFQLNHKLIALQYAAATVACSLDLEFILNMFTWEMINLLDVEGCIIFEWDQPTDAISVIAEHGLTTWREDGLLDTVCDLTDFSLAKQVLLKLHPQQITMSQADLNATGLTYLQVNKIKTSLMLPMEFRGRVVGLVEVIDSRVERIFAGEEIALAQFLANQAASAIENARLYAQAQQEIAERIQIEEKLRQNETRNRALLDAIPDLMFRMTAEGIYLDFQASDDDDLYVPPEEFLGKNVKEVMPPGPADLIMQHIDRALASGVMQVYEYQLSLPQGIQDFEARLVPSGPNEVLAIVRNITARKQTEQQLIRAERLAALGHLTATLAHEISNPLQAIQSYVDLMLKHTLEEQEKAEALGAVHSQIGRLNDLTQRVLNFAHAKPSLREQVSATELVEQVLTLVKKRLELSNIQVTTDWREVPPILAAADQLTQIFLNLIINAIEAIDHNGQINIAIYPDGEKVAISFTNTGPTIPRKILSTIFEPFFSTKAEGSGLGLWVCHSLVQQHGGSLTVENLTDSQGVVFTVKLPLSFDP
jgi:PAS domain S-box-containing protein